MAETGGYEHVQHWQVAVSIVPSRHFAFLQLVEVIPTENTGAMLVVKHQAHGIVSDRLNGKNIDIFFACLLLPDDSRKNVPWSCS